MRRVATALALASAACTTTDAPPPSPVRATTTTAPTTTTVVVADVKEHVGDVGETRHTHAPTTRAARRAPVARVTPVTAPAPVVAVGDVWERLALCESGMRPGLRNPPYSGAFQFTGPTWRSMGETGEAADYPYEYQRAVAIRLQARSGWGQWPACSRKLGLR